MAVIGEWVIVVVMVSELVLFKPIFGKTQPKLVDFSLFKRNLVILIVLL